MRSLNEIDSTVQLALAPDLQIGDSRGRGRVIKNPKCKTYLVVTTEQKEILDRFRTGKSMRDVLPRLIADRKCPPLWEWHELILKAIQANVLLLPRSKVETKSAINWNLEMSAGFATIFSVLCILAGALLFLLDPLIVPQEWINITSDFIGPIQSLQLEFAHRDLAIGYGVIILSLTIGSILAACCARWYECDICRPHLHWRTIFPHFRFDLDDCVMVGAPCTVRVAMLQIAPLFLAIGLTKVFLPASTMTVFCGIIFVLAPLENSPIQLFLRSVYGENPLAIHHSFLFKPCRRLGFRIKSALKYSRKKFIIAETLYSICWLAVALVLLFFSFHRVEVNYWDHLLQSEDAGFVSLCAFAVILCLVLLFSCFSMLRRILRGLVRHIRKRREQTKVPQVTAMPELDTIVKLLGKSPLFKDLSEEDRAEIGSAFQWEVIKRKTLLIKEEETSDTMYLIYRGLVDIFYTSVSGRKVHLAKLGPGDVFGETDLLENRPHQTSARALKKTYCLTLKREDFREQVISKIGVERTKNILQKEVFLQRTPLCANWDPYSLIHFARISVIQSYSSNEKVISENESNQFFYMVYQGVFLVMKNEKRLNKLKKGDFFGEISLLQNSAASANVIAQDNAKVLIVARGAFLEFLSSDYQIAMQFERIASKRLGYPVLPLDVLPQKG